MFIRYICEVFVFSVPICKDSERFYNFFLTLGSVGTFKGQFNPFFRGALFATVIPNKAAHVHLLSVFAEAKSDTFRQIGFNVKLNYSEKNFADLTST